MAVDVDVSDFTRRDFTFGGVTRPVLLTGDRGPAVVVIHEVFGFTPPLARFCRWIRDAGMRVYAPILLGTPDAANAQEVKPGRLLALCVSREFNLFAAGRSSRIVDWLKPLAREAHAACGGRGVGVIGMCLTGGFALAMAADPVVLAPVMAQPGLPARTRDGLDISDADLACVRRRTAEEGMQVRAYRFAGDPASPPQRFARLERELGSGFMGETLPDSAANPEGMKARGRPPHSVFTLDLVDAAVEPTRRAADEVVAFFRDRLA